MGPAAAIGHVAPTAQHMRSRLEVEEKANNEEARRKHYAEVMAWCNGEAVKAYSASLQRADDGESLLAPLISYYGLYEHLPGKVGNAQSFAHNAVLTMAEEVAIVKACKYLNCHGHGFGRRDLSELVLESLDLRPLINKGRNYTPGQLIASKAVHWPDLCVFIDDYHKIIESCKNIHSFALLPPALTRRASGIFGPDCRALRIPIPDSRFRIAHTI